MEKCLKISEVVSAYKVLSSAKYQKLDDADKIKLWKISRVLKPIAVQFEEDRADAVKTLMPESISESMGKAQEYERLKAQNADNLPMTEDEYKSFVKELSNCSKLVKDAMREILEKEVKLELEPLTEKTLGQLMVSNDWSIKQVESLECICIYE